MALLRALTAAPALLSCIALAGAVPGPLITAAPRLAKRFDAYSDSPDFIGYFTEEGASTYHYLTCYGSSFDYLSTSNFDWGGCWDQETVSVFTTCDYDTAYGFYESTSEDFTTTWYSSQSCYNGYNCVYDYLVDDPDGGSTSYFVQCPSISRDPITLIRTYSADLPAIAAATTTTDTTSSTSSTVTSTPSTTPTPTPTPIPTPTPTPTPGPKPKPKAPIAAIVGGVLGGLILLVVGGAISFFLWHKKRRAAAANPTAGHSQPVLVAGGNDGGSGGHTGGAAAAAAGGYYNSPPEKLATTTSSPVYPSPSPASPPPMHAAPQNGWANANVQPHYGIPPPPQEIYHELGGQSQQSQHIGSSVGVQSQHVGNPTGIQQQQPVEMASPAPGRSAP